jgi:hypothetical protein
VTPATIGGGVPRATFLLSEAMTTKGAAAAVRTRAGVSTGGQRKTENRRAGATERDGADLQARLAHDETLLRRSIAMNTQRSR